MLELLAYLFIASVAVLAVSALVGPLFHRQLEQIPLTCFPTDSRTDPPVSQDGRVVFHAPRDILLAQSEHEEGGWAQKIPLQQRIRIPRGYTGVLTSQPVAFRTSNGQTHFDVVCEAEILPAGWEGEPNVLLMNRNSTEPAICDQGVAFVVLYLLPTSGKIVLRDSIA